MADSKELQVKGKQEIAPPAEHTRPGMVFTPEVDIFETDRELTVLVDMPGVDHDGLNIDLRENILTLEGDIKPWEDGQESDVLVEFEIGKYYRQFALSEVIDQGSIEAKLEDGVLRLRLPKAEKAIPRQIAVTTG